MCLELFKVFRRGNPTGNIPSPRVDFDLSILVLPPGVTTTTVQNTNSMEPLIDVGHTVLIKPATCDLHVGDIVIWEQDGQRVIHSIVAIDGTDYQTQGLNIPRPDPVKIRRENIKSVAIGVIWTRGTGDYTANNDD